LRDLNIIELMKGLGALQTQPTALIQNNNIGSQPPTQNIPLEVATQEETVEVRKELLKQLK
jgi:ribosome recycling factor